MILGYNSQAMKMKTDFEFDLNHVKAEISRFIQYINQKNHLTNDEQKALSAVPLYTVVTDELQKLLDSGDYSKLVNEHELLSSIDSFIKSIEELRTSNDNIH